MDSWASLIHEVVEAQPVAHRGRGNLATQAWNLGSYQLSFFCLKLPEMQEAGSEKEENNFDPVKHSVKKIPQEIGCYLQITTGLLANSWGQSQGQLQLQLSSH